MQRLTVLFFITAFCALGADKAASNTTNAIPKGSAETSPGVYRFTDAQGKTWFYRKTPFGFVKTTGPDAQTEAGKRPADVKDGASPFGEVKASASKAAVADGSDKLRVTEDGDTLRFERPSPFGPYKWTRKKSELNAAEQEAWDRTRNAAPTGTK